MNRRNFLKTSAAAAAAATVLGPKAFAFNQTVYTRSVHFMYNTILSSSNHTLAQLTAAIGEVNTPVCLSPVFLNEANLSTPDNQAMITWLKNHSASVCFTPAVGGPTGGNNKLMDGPNGPNTTVLNSYAASLGFQPYLRVDNLSGFWGGTQAGENDVKGFLREAANKGFTKIMLNPWPQDPNGSGYMKITEPDILATINACFQNTNPSYTLNQNNITNVQNQLPGTPILVNYESGTNAVQGKIAQMTPQNQLNNVFKVTVADIKSKRSDPQNAGASIYWAPPFTGEYDPLDYTISGKTMWDYYFVPQLNANI